MMNSERSAKKNSHNSAPLLSVRVEDAKKALHEAIYQLAVELSPYKNMDVSMAVQHRINSAIDALILAVREEQNEEKDSGAELAAVENDTGTSSTETASDDDDVTRAFVAGFQGASELLALEACAIAAHQQNGRVHPLTCGIDSNHAPLVPFVKDGHIALRCLGSMNGIVTQPCPYVQDWNPLAARSFTTAVSSPPAASSAHKDLPADASPHRSAAP